MRDSLATVGYESSPVLGPVPSLTTLVDIPALFVTPYGPAAR